MKAVRFFPGALHFFLLILGITSQQALAQESDTVRGKTLTYSCLGCHGIDGYRNAYPSYRVPKLGGQYGEYIVNSLKAYKSGERTHPTMRAQAASLSEADMADIAKYLVSLGEAKKKESGKPAPEATATCTACHGDNGVGLSPEFPTLAGQQKDYLIDSLRQYQRQTVSERKNAIMMGLVTVLEDEDIQAVAEYYSSLGGLFTPAIE